MATVEYRVSESREQKLCSIKKGYSWSTVVKAFTDKGLTEDDALLNARLARILTIDDYDTKEQTPKLWTPQEAFAIDNGATVQDESD